jgi:hypothetical protein
MVKTFYSLDEINLEENFFSKNQQKAKCVYVNTINNKKGRVYKRTSAMWSLSYNNGRTSNICRKAKDDIQHQSIQRIR